MCAPTGRGSSGCWTPTPAGSATGRGDSRSGGSRAEARPAVSTRPDPRFGISVTPVAAAYPAIVEQVLTAERAGLDLVGIQDHPYQRRFLDTFALIADLAART